MLLPKSCSPQCSCKVYLALLSSTVSGLSSEGKNICYLKKRHERFLWESTPTEGMMTNASFFSNFPLEERERDLQFDQPFFIQIADELKHRSIHCRPVTWYIAVKVPERYSNLLGMWTTIWLRLPVLFSTVFFLSQHFLSDLVFFGFWVWSLFFPSVSALLSFGGPLLGSWFIVCIIIDKLRSLHLTNFRIWPDFGNLDFGQFLSWQQLWYITRVVISFDSLEIWFSRWLFHFFMFHWQWLFLLAQWLSNNGILFKTNYFPTELRLGALVSS